MTTYKRGDVVLVPFPFSNQASIKKRPAVVISSTLYNETSQDIVILAVTKPAISTIEQALVLKKLGGLSTKDIPSMDRTLRVLLGLQ